MRCERSAMARPTASDDSASTACSGAQPPRTELRCSMICSTGERGGVRGRSAARRRPRRTDLCARLCSARKLRLARLGKLLRRRRERQGVTRKWTRVPFNPANLGGAERANQVPRRDRVRRELPVCVVKLLARSRSVDAGQVGKLATALERPGRQSLASGLSRSLDPELAIELVEERAQVALRGGLHGDRWATYIFRGRFKAGAFASDAGDRRLARS